jgi:hypothetical protein
MHKIKTTALVALLVIGLAITAIPAATACEPNVADDWTLVHDGRGVKRVRLGNGETAIR